MRQGLPRRKLEHLGTRLKASQGGGKIFGFAARTDNHKIYAREPGAGAQVGDGRCDCRRGPGGCNYIYPRLFDLRRKFCKRVGLCQARNNAMEVHRFKSKLGGECLAARGYGARRESASWLWLRPRQ